MGDPQAILQLLYPEFSFPLASFLWLQQVAREPLWEAGGEMKALFTNGGELETGGGS